MVDRRVNYRAWMLKLVAWDGTLPVIIVFAPSVVEFLFPNRRTALEVMALTLPIAALFLRFVLGKRHIDANRCSTMVRYIQIVALCIAIIMLVLIDSLVILAHEMPEGALWATKTDRICWAVLIGIYLILMAIAMFPGGTDESAIEPRDFGPVTD
jgi:hypothetical protein